MIRYRAQSPCGPEPCPDLVLITTIMTYWYPGAAEAIAMARNLLAQG